MYFTDGAKYFHIINESYLGNKIEGKGISEFCIFDETIHCKNLFYSEYTFNKTKYKIISKEEYLFAFSNKVKELITDLNGKCFIGLMGMYLCNKTNIIWVNASTYNFDIDTFINSGRGVNGPETSNLDFIEYLTSGYNYTYHYL